MINEILIPRIANAEDGASNQAVLPTAVHVKQAGNFCFEQRNLKNAAIRYTAGQKGLIVSKHLLQDQEMQQAAGRMEIDRRSHAIWQLIHRKALQIKQN